jgi:hypothetical protein
MRPILAVLALTILATPAFADTPVAATALGPRFTIEQLTCRRAEIVYASGAVARQYTCAFPTDFAYRPAVAGIHGDQVCTVAEKPAALEREAARAFPGREIAIITSDRVICAEPVTARR